MQWLTRAQSREIDRRAMQDYGMPGIVLMENAGRGITELLIELGIDGPVHVVCGKGNNGGDGLVIARHLDNHQYPVVVHLAVPGVDLGGDAAINYQIARKSQLRMAEIERPGTLANELTHANWVVDSLFGTGLTGVVSAHWRDLIACMNSSGKRILSVDLPSGMDADTGQPLGIAVRAEHTATMVAPKAGFGNPNARQWTGEVHVVDIGAPRHLLESLARSLESQE